MPNMQKLANTFYGLGQTKTPRDINISIQNVMLEMNAKNLLEL